ncbi:helix-turn-helix domain-containing protein [Herbiconiux sp. 11R-BC]|uniref:helix-turn-helix domain-containing protein n=1 Tax=Herbiconiux sp. 11R-BC TaxID=3111637 RepID=UPI003C035A1C
MPRPLRRFTPRKPAHTELVGREGIELMGWHSAIGVADPEAFRGSLSIVVFDETSVARSRLSAGRQVRSAAHVDALDVGTTFVFLHRGRATARQGGHELALSPGSVAILNGFEPYEIEGGDDYDAAAVTLARNALARFGVPDFERDTRELPRSVLTSAAAAFLLALTDDLPRPGSAEGMTTQRALQTMLVGMLVSAYASTDEVEGHAERLARAVAFIESNAADPDLDAADVATALGISVRHLQRVLGAAGTSVSDEIRACRLRTAAAYLGDPGWRSSTLDEIAAACGFGSASRLRRAFQAVHGMSPVAFRASAPPLPDTALTRH